MERASGRCFQWISSQPWQDRHHKIFCGKGNNGGDGLAIARMLVQSGYKVSIYILEFGKPGSPDFQTNLQRLHELPVADLHYIQSEDLFPELDVTDVLIDALFGTGLNKPLEGLTTELVDYINQSNATVVAVDLPSGLFADQSSKGNAVIKATYTLSFQTYKFALLVQENAPFIGETLILDIGLHQGYLAENQFRCHFVGPAQVKSIFRPRNRFANKGNFGHSLLIGGSYGKMGAAVLATKACIHSGAGLTTAYTPACGYVIMQTTVPEAMIITDPSEDYLSTLPDEIEKYSIIGIGPGIGTHNTTKNLVSFIIRRYQKPMVIDADGLNCLAREKALFQHLPSHSILTPHPKEFDRLFGEHQSDFERINTARQQAVALNCILIVKGHHTLIASPDDLLYFNSTGNAGLAKGGSGDVLTGIITALAAQGYDPTNAAVLGVYLHGLAGDLAAQALSQEAMTPTDIITFLSQGFQQL